jgi:nucleoside 2-deoxyribosyltransferase
MARLNRTQTVYLAGPITGLTYDDAEDWRQYAKKELAKAGIKALSPLRANEHLRGAGILGPMGVGEAPRCLSATRAIMVRDRNDAMTCDVLLVNLLGAKTVSIGTMMEIAWADSQRTPIVAVMEPGNIHEHAMVDEAIGFRVNTLEDAIFIVKTIIDNDEPVKRAA